MTKEEAKKWLEDTVSDMFIDLCYYDRKGDAEMSVEHFKTLTDNGIIDKEMFIEVFTNQINKEFE